MENTTPEKLGRYEIIRELGKGAMGVVYEGKDPSLGRRVAIKTARKDVIERSGLAKEMMERFLREARAAGVLNHPNIITIYDVGEEAGMAYIAMEYLEGRDLDTLIEEQRRFDVETVVDYGVQICEALACAHEQGVIHRDVKPANIFIPDNGVLKVVDFGIARTHDSTLTQDGALIGTPTYMSPEQFMGQKVDARSDLFSAGIILYEMLTGEKPFTGEALTTIMHHILKSDPAPPHELNYMVPEHVSAVVMRALSKKAKDRYTNGNAMAKALREGLKDDPDMSIINGVAATVAETVVSKVPVAKKAPESVPDGTIIEEETMNTPGGALDKLSSNTVAGGVPAGFNDFSDEPAPAPAAAAPEATPQPAPQSLPGVTPPQSLPGMPAPKPSLVQLAMQHSRVVFGSIAVLCLVVGFGTYLLAPEQMPPEVIEQPAIATTTPTPETVTTQPVIPADTTPTVAPPAKPKLVNSRIYIYSTNEYTVVGDFTEKLNAGENVGDWIFNELPEGSVVAVSRAGVSVRTSNKDTGQVYDKQPISAGTGSVQVPASAGKVYYEILLEGLEQPLLNVEITKEQGEVSQSFILSDSAFPQ